MNIHASDDFDMICSHCHEEVASCQCDGGIGSPFHGNDELNADHDREGDPLIARGTRDYIFEDSKGPDNPKPAMVRRPPRTHGLFTPRELELNEVQQESYRTNLYCTEPNPWRGIDEGKATAWDAGLHQRRLGY